MIGINIPIIRVMTCIIIVLNERMQSVPTVFVLYLEYKSNIIGYIIIAILINVPVVCFVVIHRPARIPIKRLCFICFFDVCESSTKFSLCKARS